MEKLKNGNIAGYTTRNFVVSALLAGALGLCFSSCGKTTQKDINEQRQKIELLSINIFNYINARKNLVNQYNKILAYPKTDANRFEIDEHLGLLEEQIFDYDEKIRDLVEEKIGAEADLNEKIEDMGTTGSSALDPGKRDYLLSIK